MPDAKSRIASDKRRRSRGITAKSLATNAKTAVAPMVRRRKKPATLVKYNNLRNLFDEYIEVVHSGTYKQDGNTVRTWAEWVAAGMSFPSINIIESFLEFFIDGSTPKIGSAIQQSSLDRISKVFMAVWRYDTLELISGERRTAVNGLVKHLNHKFGLPSCPQRRAKLDRQSIIALIHGAMDPDFPCFPRHRVSIMLYLALTSQTATRPMASLRYRLPTGPAAGGARYQQFRLFAMRDPSARINKLGGFFKTRDDKNDFGKHRIYPLPPGPLVKLSTPHLVLFSALCDGIFTRLDIERFLDPLYLESSDFKDIAWPSACLDRIVLCGHKGAGLTSQIMTSTLADLSIHLGFRDLVHAYAPRHMVAQALRAARIDVERIKDIMAHDPRGSGLGYYMGNTVLMNCGKVMKDGKLEQTVERQQAAALGSRAHANAPKVLTPEQLDVVANLPHITEARERRDAARLAWCTDRKNPDVIRRYKKMVQKYQYAEKVEKRIALLRERQSFFDRLDNGQANASSMNTMIAPPATNESLAEILSVEPSEVLTAFEKAERMGTAKVKKGDNLKTCGFRILAAANLLAEGDDEEGEDDQNVFDYDIPGSDVEELEEDDEESDLTSDDDNGSIDEENPLESVSEEKAL